MMWWMLRVFGNGMGTAAPSVNSKFYWLVDEQTEQKRRGQFYQFWPGAGAQLTSFEARCPRPGTSRVINGRRFFVFDVSRGSLRVGGLFDIPAPFAWRVSWADQGSSRLDAEGLRNLEKELMR